MNYEGIINDNTILKPFFTFISFYFENDFGYNIWVLSCVPILSLLFQKRKCTNNYGEKASCSS